jgi:flagellar basal body-associated protein FliL
MITVYQKKSNWLIRLLIILAVCAALVAVISFVLYGRARMQERTPQEKQYLAVHYTSLFILLLLGIVYMFFMVQTAD